MGTLSPILRVLAEWLGKKAIPLMSIREHTYKRIMTMTIVAMLDAKINTSLVDYITPPSAVVLAVRPCCSFVRLVWHNNAMRRTKYN